MMRAGPTPTPRAAVMRHAERQGAGVMQFTSVRFYGPATLLYVEALGTVNLRALQPGLGVVTLTFNDLTPGVWHPMPPFVGFAAGSDVGEMAVGYQ